MQLEKKKKKKKKAFRIIFLIAEIMAETIRIIKIGKNSKKKGCKKLRERFLSRIRRNGDLLNAYGQKKKGNNPGGIPPVHRTQHLRRGEAHGNYPLILFISGRGYITARWGKEPEVVKGRKGLRFGGFAQNLPRGIPSRKRRRSPIIEGGLMRATMTGHIQPPFCSIRGAASKCTGRFVNRQAFQPFALSFPFRRSLLYFSTIYFPPIRFRYFYLIFSFTFLPILRTFRGNISSIFQFLTVSGEKRWKLKKEILNYSFDVL